MSLKQIITYNKLRAQMTPSELELADVLYKASETEKTLLIESLQPQKPAAKKAGKTTRIIERCHICHLTRRAKHHKDQTQRDYHEFELSPSGEKAAGKKSARASGMAAQLNKSLQEQRRVATDDGGDDLCVICAALADHNVHRLNSHPSYHPFRTKAQDIGSAASTSNAHDDNYAGNLEQVAGTGNITQGVK